MTEIYTSLEVVNKSNRRAHIRLCPGGEVEKVREDIEQAKRQRRARTWKVGVGVEVGGFGGRAEVENETEDEDEEDDKKRLEINYRYFERANNWHMLGAGKDLTLYSIASSYLSIIIEDMYTPYILQPMLIHPWKLPDGIVLCRGNPPFKKQLQNRIDDENQGEPPFSLENVGTIPPLVLTAFKGPDSFDLGLREKTTPQIGKPIAKKELWRKAHDDLTMKKTETFRLISLAFPNKTLAVKPASIDQRRRPKLILETPALEKDSVDRAEYQQWTQVDRQELVISPAKKAGLCSICTFCCCACCKHCIEAAGAKDDDLVFSPKGQSENNFVYGNPKMYECVGLPGHFLAANGKSVEIQQFDQGSAPRRTLIWRAMGEERRTSITSPVQNLLPLRGAPPSLPGIVDVDEALPPSVLAPAAPSSGQTAQTATEEITIFDASAEQNMEVLARLIEQKGAKCLEEVDSDGCTALHCATLNGKAEAAKKIIEGGRTALIKMATKSYPPPIHVAASKGDVELVGTFLDAGLAAGGNDLFTLPDKFGNTIASEAAEEGHLEVLKEIVARQKDPKVFILSLKDKRGRTPLHLAVREGHNEVSKHLLELGGPAFLDKATNNGDTPFIVAADSGNLPMVRLMYSTMPKERRKELLDQTNNGGWKAVHRASRKGHTVVINELLKAGGAAILRDRTKNDETPFILAAAGGSVAVMELIYKYDGKPLLEERTKSQWTALHCAANNGHATAVRKLLNWGGVSLLEQRTDGQFTPFLSADQAGRKSLLEEHNKLLDWGGLPLLESFTDGGYTAFLTAAGGGHVKVMRTIYERVPEDRRQGLLEQQGKGGRTALHCASANGHLEAVRQLLQWDKAALARKNDKGETPYEVAKNKDIREAMDRYRT
ncbi:unnamed protein product [Vitrella brassicaformis CCMP3155]|uniref:Uncharacterized protein n=1 Tax=Vitrella brassicaformis (strain CCMP3155) TaxID=1169540 RepID=A0A0G4ESP9_VITBC|nr:unnamed protein product [Vitrella brassicaformis CCMP3155]|eukprot:CEM00726.1 unnamed protein product [Vitrella brassicaformis CCMP3155]